MARQGAFVVWVRLHIGRDGGHVGSRCVILTPKFVGRACGDTPSVLTLQGEETRTSSL